MATKRGFWFDLPLHYEEESDFIESRWEWNATLRPLSQAAAGVHGKSVWGAKKKKKSKLRDQSCAASQRQLSLTSAYAHFSLLKMSLLPTTHPTEWALKTQKKENIKSGSNESDWLISIFLLWTSVSQQLVVVKSNRVSALSLLRAEMWCTFLQGEQWVKASSVC